MSARNKGAEPTSERAVLWLVAAALVVGAAVGGVAVAAPGVSGMGALGVVLGAAAALAGTVAAPAVLRLVR